MKMEYDTSLAKEAYGLATKWDQARDVNISDLSFQSTDLDDFNTTQKSLQFSSVPGNSF